MIVNKFNADEKILHYTDKLDRYFNSHKTLIVTELDLTNRCNNNCPLCCGVNENGSQLCKEQIDRIINSLMDIENKGVILSGGGEPLISPYFGYAVKQLKCAGMKLGLNSNGLALTDEKIDIILESCEYFRVSLDAATPEMYERTHGMNEIAFRKTIENCKKFVEKKKKIGNSISFGLGFLTSKETKSEMSLFVQLCKEIGADFAQFRPFTGDCEDVTDVYLALKEKYQSPVFSVTASVQKYREMKTIETRSYNKCYGMFFSTVITADAKVFACLHYRQNEKYYLGNLDESTLSDIFRSSRMKEVYENIDCSKCPPLCRNDAFNRTLETFADNNIAHKEFL
jgi:MoaA/NifB/PqqE/SkfB family radical SAM enzyme